MPDAGHIASTTGGGTGSAAQIVTRGLTKTFAGKPAVTALSDIDLVVPRGQFCCIVGPSGCGKTTLLRIVAGLDTHSGGRLELLHYDRTKPLDSMIFQEQSIFPWMTVADNIAYGLRRRGVPAAERRERVGYFVDKVGLTVSVRRRPPCSGDSDSADSLLLVTTGEGTALCLEIGLHLATT